MGDPARLQPFPHEVEHFHELAKNEDAVAAVDGLLEQLGEEVELGGTFLRRVRRDSEQAKIATRLAQAEQPGEHFHPRRAIVRATSADPLLNFAQECLVCGALL